MAQLELPLPELVAEDFHCSAALQDAIDIKHALEFDGSEDSINTIGHSKRKVPEISDNASLHQTLETLTKCLQSLEATMQKTHKAHTTPRHNEDNGYANRRGQ